MKDRRSDAFFTDLNATVLYIAKFAQQMMSGISLPFSNSLELWCLKALITTDE